MAGPLQSHPFYRSYDELQRTLKRVQNYLDINFMDLTDDEKENINIMIEAIEKALKCIPDSFKLTKHEQRVKKEGKFWQR